MNENKSYIDKLNLRLRKKGTGETDSIIMSLNFSIQGSIREALTQKNWEKAYNKHDNSLRLTIELDIKNNGKVIESKKLIQKAIFFWTRNPKINHRIWIMIMKDDSPYYPLEEEEARNLLFEFNKDVEIESAKLRKGNNNLSIVVNVYWGKHIFIDKERIIKESNIEPIQLLD